MSVPANGGTARAARVSLDASARALSRYPVPSLTPTAAREQRTFRTWLNTMARPGSVATVDPHPSGGTFAHLLSLLEAVLDHEVTFTVVPEHPTVIEGLLRLTGSRMVSPPQADYLLCTGDSAAAALTAAKIGTPEYPDQSATVIVQVAAVHGGLGGSAPQLAPVCRGRGVGNAGFPTSEDRGEPLTLHGPGINGTRTVWVTGFPAAARAIFAERNAEVPMGIDLVLLAPDGRFTCLTRYTRVAPVGVPGASLPRRAGEPPTRGDGGCDSPISKEEAR